MPATNKHRWTEDEDRIAVKEVFKTYVQSKNFQLFIKNLSKKLPNIPENSIKMKIQNIKALLNQRKIPNTLETGSLSNWSKQCEKCFDDAHSDYLQKNIDEKVESKKR